MNNTKSFLKYNFKNFNNMIGGEKNCQNSIVDCQNILH